MIKYLLLLINMFVLFVLNSIFSDIGVTINAPGQVEAGNEILVKIFLDKSDFDSFARFQQEIPAGLTPVPIETSNADFSFSNQKVKFIWLKLPNTDKISISYKLIVDQRLKGNFNLEGTFSYIADNDRKSVSVSPVNITIIPSTTIDQKLIVDINDFKNLVAPVRNNVSGIDQVKCIRQTPYLADEGEYIVNLLVNKGNKEKFAKIQENIPEGFTAVSIENKDAIFTYKDNTIKLLWMNLPADPYFVVTYKLIPDKGNSEKPILNGTLSYIEKDNTLSVDIIEQDVNLSNTSKENLLAVVSLVTEADNEPVNIVQPQDYSGKVKIEIAESALRAMREDTKLTSMLEPESGIYYRVQIAAGHRPININRYFKKYNLDKDVRTEFHEGWRKYSVGSFMVYKGARDYRVHIWNTTTIDDAFVSAYNNGKRVTVQEALMITNNKWCR